eukprot:10250025-Lingulodinium_polyedra.AAC.1
MAAELRPFFIPFRNSTMSPGPVSRRTPARGEAPHANGPVLLREGRRVDVRGRAWFPGQLAI